MSKKPSVSLFDHGSAVNVCITCADGCENRIQVEQQCLGRDIWDKFTSVFDLNEQDFFGLVYEVPSSRKEDPQSTKPAYQWLILDEPALPQLGQPVLTETANAVEWQLSFRIKFYVSHEQTALWDDYARYLFFLQLTHDMMHNRLIVDQDVRAELLGFAAQVECGDWNEEKHSDVSYFVDYDLVQSKSPMLTLAMQHHKQCKGMTTNAAQTAFIALAQEQHMYGVDLYRSRDNGGKPVTVGVCPIGINLYRDSSIITYTWARIKNIQFKRRNFMLTFRNEKEEGSSSITVGFSSKVTCKALWKSAIQHHTFFRRKSTPRAAANKRRRKAEAIAMSVGSTLQEACENAIKRSTTKPQEGTLRSRLSEDAAFTVNRAERASSANLLAESYRTVVLRRDAAGFGFSVIGPGVSEKHAGIFIAKTSGKDTTIQPGDLVLAANGMNLAQATLAEAFQAFNRAKQILVLDVAHSAQGFERAKATYAPDEEIVIGSKEFQRRSTRKPVRMLQSRRESWATGLEQEIDGITYCEVKEDVMLDVAQGKLLGMSICGGEGDSLRKGDSAIYIKKIFSSGIVAADGRLQEGDRICEINKKRLDRVTHDDAVAVIQDAMHSGKVHLVVSRIVEKSKVTREEQFHGRHGLVRRSLSHDGFEVSYQRGRVGVDDLLVVEVGRDNGRYGFDLIGTTKARAAGDTGGVFISAVHAGTRAAAHGCLARGLQLIDVNGWQVEKATVAEVEGLLSSSTMDKATLTLRPNPDGFAAIAEQSDQRHYAPYLPPNTARQRLPAARVVVLERESVSESWGLRVLGRETTSTLPARKGGVFISGIAEGSVAARSGRLQAGDQVLEVNGLCMNGASHHTASQTLKTSGLTAKLYVVHNPRGMKHFEREMHALNQTVSESLADFELRAIRISRESAAQAFGIVVDGPDESSDEPRDGVFVTRLIAPVARASSLRVGDQLVEINSENVLAGTREQADALLNSSNVLELVVTANPTGFDKYRDYSGGEERLVTLQRGAHGFGFTVCGPDAGGSGAPGVYVASVSKHGPCAQGDVVVGDQIISINGIITLKATAPDVEELLNDSGANLTLIVCSNPGGFEPYRKTARKQQASIRKTEQRRQRKSLRQLQGATKVKHITLKRASPTTPWGLSICGPQDADDETAGVFIATVAPNGVAHEDGRVAVGDQLLSVNSHDVRLANVEDVMNLLIHSDTEATISLATNNEGFAQYRDDIAQVQRDVRTISIDCTDARGPGISVVGGSEAGDDVFVSVVHVGGPAERCGHLRVGDQILTVNGQEVTGLSLLQVESMLQAACDAITVDVVDNPSGFAPFKEDMRKKRYSQTAKFVSPMELRLIELPCNATSPRRASFDPCLTSEAFGFTLTGFSETRVGPQRSGVFVSSVAKSSAADRCGLHVGDQLIELSGASPGEWTSLRAESYQQAQRLLARALVRHEGSCHTLSLVVVENMEGFLAFSQAANCDRTRVVLRRDREDAPLGFDLAACKQHNAGTQPGIFVSHVVSGSGAEAAGVRMGHQLLDINGHVVESVDLEACAALLSQQTGEVVLCFQENKQGYDRVMANGPATVSGAAMDDISKRATAILQRHQQQQQQEVLHGDASAANEDGHARRRKESGSKAGKGKRGNGASPGSLKTGKKKSSRRRSKQRRQSRFPPLPFHVRALFDFEPEEHWQLGFKCRDILEVTDVSDREWWEARNVESGQQGRIPSRNRREKDFMMTREWADLCARAEENVSKAQKRLTLTNKTPEERKAEAVSIRSYQVVTKRDITTAFKRPLAIIGPESLRITEAVRHVIPSIDFVHAVPHTTRPPRQGEVDGIDYFFVSREQMDELLAQKKFIEAGRYKGNLYGTSLAAIRGPAEEGQVVILDTQLKAIQRLQQFGDIHPVVIFLRPQSVEDLHKSLQQAAAADNDGQTVDRATADALYNATMATQTEFDHLFTHVVDTGASLARTVKAVASIVVGSVDAGFWGATFTPLPLTPPPVLQPASAAASVRGHRSLGSLAEEKQKEGGEQQQEEERQQQQLKAVPEHEATTAHHAQGEDRRADAVNAAAVSRDAPATATAAAAALRSSSDSATDGWTGSSGAEEGGSKQRGVKRRSKDRTVPRGIAPVTVVVRRNEKGSFGFSVAGGIEDDLLPAIVLRPNVTPIVVRGEPLNKGDEIVSVNGVNVAGESHAEVIRLIKGAGHEVTLSILKRKANQSYRKVSELMSLPSMDDDAAALQDQVKSTLYSMTVPVTSRPRQEGEIDGQDYRFVSTAEFEEMIKDGQLIEWGKYKGHFYGTPKVLPSDLDPNRQFQRSRTFRNAMKNKDRKGTRVNTVILQRDPQTNGFGVEFQGGIEKDELPTITQLENPIVLSSSYGNIQEGDCILAINSVNVAGSTHGSAMQLLESAADTVELLVLCRDAQTPKHHRSIREFLAPSVHDDDALKAIKADVRRGMYSHTVPLTTRKPREGEKHGVDYYFISKEEFEEMIQRDELYEWGERNGVLYGTRRAPQGNNNDSGGLIRCTSLTKRSSVSDLARPTRVTIKRGEFGFGFSIVHVREQPCPGMYVSKVKHGSPAEEQGGLREGVQVLAVNGQDLTSATKEEALEALRSTGDYISLLVRSNPQGYAGYKGALRRDSYQQAADIDSRIQRLGARNVRIVDLARTEKGYGLRIAKDDELGVVHVTQVLPQCRATNVEAGDAIVQVDEHPVQDMQHEEVLDVLRRKSKVTLVVASLPDVRVVEDTEAAAAADAEYGYDTFVDDNTQEQQQQRDERRVHLQKRNGSFGFTVTSDPDTGLHARVASIVTGSVASECAFIFPGDRIMGINGEDVSRLAHGEIIARLRAADRVDLDLHTDTTPLPAALTSSPKSPPSHQPSAEATPEKASSRAGVRVGGLEPLQEETTIDGDGYDNLGSAAPRAAGSLDAALDDESDAQTVQIRRGPTGLGLTIITDEEAGVVRVADVASGGAAAKAGKIHAGDRILAINGCVAAGKEHADVIDLLRAGDTVTLVVCRDDSPLPDPDTDEEGWEEDDGEEEQDVFGGEVEERRVTLHKTSLGFGMRISSPSDNDVGACVTTLVENGPAALTGMVRENDVIVSINGIDVLDMQHDDIIDILKNNSTVDLVLSSDLSLLGLTLVQERRVVVLQRTEQGYGMKVTTDETLGIVRITAVTENGPAYESDLVFVGDVVVEVNGQPLAGRTHKEVIELLTAKDEAELLLLADDSPLPVAETGNLDQDFGVRDIRVVHLKREDRGLGLRLAPSDEAEYGAVVVDIVPGGAASLNKNIRLNDILVEIDGMNVLDVEYNEILNMLVSKQQVTLTLSNDLALLGLQPVDRRVVKVKNSEEGYGMEVAANPAEGYVQVVSVDPLGAAGRTSQVFAGDTIEMVNNQFVGDMTQEEVVEMLTEYDQVELVLLGNATGVDRHLSPNDLQQQQQHKQHSGMGTMPTGVHAPASNLITNNRDRRSAVANRKSSIFNCGTHKKVPLRKGANGFGLNLTYSDTLQTAVVANVASNSPAEEGGQLAIGDVVTAINGVSTVGIPLEETAQLLRSCGDHVELSVISDVAVVQLEDGTLPVPASLRTVVLERTKQTPLFGIHLTTTNGRVRVCEILPCSAADVCGDVFPGDAIVAVDGEVVEGKTKQDVADAMRHKQRVVLVLDADSSPLPENNDIVAEELISLKRKVGESLGFSFETFDNTPGVFVKRVKSMGVAAKDGRLRVGDRIIEVNGTDVMDADHTDVLSLLGDRNETQFDILVLRISSQTDVDPN